MLMQDRTYHSKQILRRAAPDDRRSSNRLPIERDVRYKVLGGKKTIKQTGIGKTLNIAAEGCFYTETALPEGERIELAVTGRPSSTANLPHWLVAMGRWFVPTIPSRYFIERYEFKTRGSLTVCSQHGCLRPEAPPQPAPF
jgi:hypothetical protein